MGDGGSGNGCHFGMVKRRGDLDQIHTDKVQSAEPSYHLKRLPAGKAARDRRACAGGKSRVKHINIKTDIARLITDAFGNLILALGMAYYKLRDRLKV